jgi:hypothetical protein
MIEDLKKIRHLIKEINAIPFLSYSITAEILFEIAICNLEGFKINYKILFLNLKNYNHNLIRLKVKKLESNGVINHELGSDGRMRFMVITDEGWSLINQYLKTYRKNNTLDFTSIDLSTAPTAKVENNRVFASSGPITAVWASQ